MKKELQDIEDEREIISARRYFTKVQLEGKTPTRFFCSMNKKMKSRAQFEEVIWILKKQSSVEWKVRKYYWSLYRKEETFCNKQDILEKIGEVKRISEEDE